MTKKEMIEITKAIVKKSREYRDADIAHFKKTMMSGEDLKGMISMFRADHWDLVAVTKALREFDYEKAGSLLRSMDTPPREVAFDIIRKESIVVDESIVAHY